MLSIEEPSDLFLCGGAKKKKGMDMDDDLKV